MQVVFCFLLRGGPYAGPCYFIDPHIEKTVEEVVELYKHEDAPRIIGMTTLEIDRNSPIISSMLFSEKSNGPFSQDSIHTVQKLMDCAYRLGALRSSLPQIPIWFFVEVEDLNITHKDYWRFRRLELLPQVPREGDRLNLNARTRFYDFIVEEVCYSEEWGDRKSGGIYEVLIKPVVSENMKRVREFQDWNNAKEKLQKMLDDFRDPDSGWTICEE